MIATSLFLTALECTKFDFGRGSAPDPTGEAYSAPTDSLAGLRGLLLRRGKGKGRERRGGERGEEVGEGQGMGDGREGVQMPGKGEGKGGIRRKGRKEK